MSLGNSDLEKDLEELPEQVSKALEIWHIAKLDREKVDATLYMKFRVGSTGKRTQGEIEAMINRDDEHYNASLKEITAECNYNFLYEKLLSAKKRASLRTAF